MSDNVDYESLQSKTTSISTKKYILTLSPYISSFFSLLKDEEMRIFSIKK